jgi:PKHD-type hydroxylase
MNEPWYLKSTTCERWAYLNNTFTAEECEKIIETGLKIGLKNGRVKDDGKQEGAIRKSQVSFLDYKDESVEWIFRRVTDFVVAINKQFWDFDLHYIETLQFTTYTEQGDFYTSHTDQMFVNPHYRKLSFSIQLSDPENYEGSDLVLHISHVPEKTFRNQGDMIFFPSYVLHEVTPLVKGKRYSLVGWVCGPPFR